MEKPNHYIFKNKYTNSYIRVNPLFAGLIEFVKDIENASKFTINSYLFKHLNGLKILEKIKV